jgi:deaminated glutathione amidase
VRLAAVQLNSNEDRGRNLARAERFVRLARDRGAQLVLLPERFDLRGSEAVYERDASSLDGEVVRWAASLARELSIDLVAGSITERRDGHEKVSNTAVHLTPDGELQAVYRKIHLFNVTVGDVAFRESDSGEPGDEIVVSHASDGTPIGLSICYDLRFPELYRILALEGALVLLVPANFTRVTGQAHWEVLLRARAIENQAFVVAAAQVGACPAEQGPAYGNSMVVDPWGEVLARGSDEGEEVVVADVDLDRAREVRDRLPSLANRVAGAYRWPVEAHV